jgi:hypothetical protein
VHFSKFRIRVPPSATQDPGGEALKAEPTAVVAPSVGG